MGQRGRCGAHTLLTGSLNNGVGQTPAETRLTVPGASGKAGAAQEDTCGSR